VETDSSAAAAAGAPAGVPRAALPRDGFSLRTKLALLAAVFGITLGGAMWVAVWCVEVPFAEASDEFQKSSAALLDVARLRALLQSERLVRVKPGEAQEAAARRSQLRAAQPELLARILSNMDERAAAPFLLNAQRLLARKNDAPDSAPERGLPDAFDELDHLLDETAIKLGRHAAEATAESYRTRREVITILTVTTSVGAMVAVLGLLLLRRWVLVPIAELQTAARHIAAGDLEQRVPVRSSDELGRLAEQVNRMTVALAEMNRTVARQERLAATGEMIAYVAHNIRNPLAGIRALAEASRAAGVAEPELHERQQMIIESVDKFDQWLRSLEHSMRPLEIRPEPADPAVMIESVLSVYRPMAARHRVSFVVRRDADLSPVRVDARHFEQALAAIIGNAIEASPAGDEVTIHVGRHAGEPPGWYLSVADRGPGIAAERRAQIFEPFYTTKRAGSGMGLALARRILELHGGSIDVTCPPDGGSIFRIEMPD
jgi:signal transduction histidine kinase